MRRGKCHGFTLIELLIVVAIIGILAAIAVPNFMNAQIRAKVARCYSDMKSTTTAISIFNTEKGMMLVDIRDDDNDFCMDRILESFNGVGHNGGGGNRNNTAVLSPLTSPVSYMSSLPMSPFVQKSMFTNSSGNNEAWGREGNEVYAYWDNDPEVKNDAGTNNPDFNLQWMGRFAPRLKPWEFILISYGPAAGTSTTLTTGMPYNPSNGLISAGEIFLTNGGINNENCGDKQ